MGKQCQLQRRTRDGALQPAASGGQPGARAACWSRFLAALYSNTPAEGVKAPFPALYAGAGQPRFHPVWPYAISGLVIAASFAHGPSNKAVSLVRSRSHTCPASSILLKLHPARVHLFRPAPLDHESCSGAVAVPSSEKACEGGAPASPVSPEWVPVPARQLGIGLSGSACQH